MARPKQEEISGLTGPGVEVPRIKKLDQLGDKFIEIRDEKAELAEKLGDTEKSMIEVMVENGISKYRFGDQEITIKPGKNHVKIKTVKVEGAEPEAE